MSRIPGLRRFMRIEHTGASIDRAVNDELHFHFEMTLKELMAKGMTPEDARAEAQRRFGNVERTRERLANIDRARLDQEKRAEWWSAFAQDFRYALRGLRLKPGFALSIIITLGLGIGANAAMFGIVDRLLFRPPNLLSAPDRTGRLYFTTTSRGKDRTTSGLGYRRFLDIRERTTTLDAMTPWTVDDLPLGTGDATREVHIGVSNADLWTMFDVKPVIGRFFTEAENDPTTPANVLVLSYAAWQTEFGGRKDAIGRSVNLGPRKYSVIGVAPQNFSGFANQPLVGFISIASSSQDDGGGKDPWYATYNMIWFEAFGHRKPGATLQATTTDLTHAFEQSYRKQVEKQQRRATPFALAKPHAVLGPVLTDRGPNAGSAAKVATWLAGVALIVLLIACANVANLLLARALKRRREIAVRIALGVSRSRLLLQLLTESLVLAVLGGVTGLGIAQFGGAAMQRLLLDRQTVSSFTDTRVIAVVSLLAAFAGLLTGIAPVAQAWRVDVAESLKAGAREGNVHRSRVRAGLLIAQAALSVVLLVGAGLFVRSLLKVDRLRLGFDGDRLLWVSLHWRGVDPDSAASLATKQDLVARATRVAGVESAARGLSVPFWMTYQPSLFVDGIDSVSKLGDFTLQAGTPELLKTLGTRVIRGRGITAADREDAPRVVVVTEAMAKKLWPGEDAIGKCIRVRADTMPCTSVVGIAEDVRRSRLEEPDFHFFLPIAQFQPQQGGVFVRTADAAENHVESVRRALQAGMPGDAYVTALPMSEIIAPNTRSWRLGATMFSIFGGLALVLAAVGLYSVIAYNVTQRMHEMGVRVALGAQARDIVALIVREGLRIVLPGVLIGAVIAVIASRWVAPLLFDVSPKDPGVIAIVIVTLVLVAVAASWLPATRAARVDANEALRAD
jgi:putative ABC transport system permease protein